MEDWPDPEWLIDNLLLADTQAVLFGAPGDCKSFVALSFALSVATGRPWLGREVKQGLVVYIAAEGARGIRKRMKAWQKEHGEVNHNNPSFVLAAPQLLDGNEIAGFVKAILRQLPTEPALIVLDTLARTLVGGDENAAKDMGKWAAGAHEIQKATGATVLTLHHTVKRKQKNGAPVERGSSALRGAMDTMMAVTKRDAFITLTCEKQKDDEPFEDIQMFAKRVDVGVPIRTTGNSPLAAMS